MECKRDSNTALSRREVLKRGLYGGLKASLAAGLWLSGCSKRRSRKSPNIILILVDTLRADRVGLYGYHRNISPTIDDIGSQGVVFERAVAPAPWTQPSVASMFCSYYPGVHKVLDLQLAEAMRLGTVRKMSVFSDSFVTMAELLREHGYETAAFVANFLTSSYYGFGQGFGHYADMRYLWKDPDDDMSGRELNGALLSWLRQRKSDKPLFLYLHYMDVHGPYYARPEFYQPLFKQVEQMPNKRRLSVHERQDVGYIATAQAAPIVAEYEKLSNYAEFWSAFYDAGVRELDQHIADLRTSLMRMHLWDDSYIIITSDHGEELLEHGYWGHGNTLYNTELRIPLIFRWPGVLPAAKRVGRTARLIDLIPTFIDLLGMERATGIQGRSLQKDIIGNPSKQPVPAFGEAVKNDPYKKSLSLGDWKLIVDTGGLVRELYNVADDPQEQRNLYRKHSAKADELTKLLSEQTTLNERLSLKTKAQHTPITPEDYERLKSLGYVK